MSLIFFLNFRNDDKTPKGLKWKIETLAGL